MKPGNLTGVASLVPWLRGSVSVTDVASGPDKRVEEQPLLEVNGLTLWLVPVFEAMLLV